MELHNPKLQRLVQVNPFPPDTCGWRGKWTHFLLIPPNPLKSTQGLGLSKQAFKDFLQPRHEADTAVGLLFLWIVLDLDFVSLASVQCGTFSCILVKWKPNLKMCGSIWRVALIGLQPYHILHCWQLQLISAVLKALIEFSLSVELMKSKHFQWVQINFMTSGSGFGFWAVRAPNWLDVQKNDFRDNSIARWRRTWFQLIEF